MKKSFLLLLCAGFMGMLFMSTPAMAVPMLQLDILGGTYDPISETTIASSTQFTLVALLSDQKGVDVSATKFSISAAVAPKVAETLPDLGSFTWQGTPFFVTGGMKYGTPPDPTGELASHGIFETYFLELLFDFSSAVMIPSYDVQLDTAGPSKEKLYAMYFNVNTAGLDPNYLLHFDLYGFVDGKFIFAPFSHDAQSAPVPEPATMLLLGAGLIGLAAFGRKRFRRE